MNTQPSALNPQPLPGYVVTFYQHYKGNKLGPYYARHYIVRGKRKKQYIKKEDLERVRAACQAYREKIKTGKQIARDLRNTLGNINWLYRMSRRLEKRPIRPEDHAFAAMIEKHGISIPGRPKLRNRNPHPCPSPCYARRGNAPFSVLYAHRTMCAFSELPSPCDEGAGGGGGVGVPKSTSNNPQPKVFMDHSLDKFLKQSKKDAIRIANHLMAQETDEQKWARWRNAHGQTPHPRPIIRVRAPLPDWLGRDMIDDAVTNLINEMGGNLLSSKGRGQ